MIQHNVYRTNLSTHTQTHISALEPFSFNTHSHRQKQHHIIIFAQAAAVHRLLTSEQEFCVCVCVLVCACVPIKYVTFVKIGYVDSI